MFCVPGSCADCWYPKDSQGASYSSTFLQRPVSGLWWTSTSVGLLQWDLGNTKSAQFLRAGGVSSGHCHFLLPGSQSASDDQCIQCCPSVPKMLVWWHDDMMTWWANFPVLLAPYFRIKSGFLQISKSLHTPSYSPTQSLAVYIGLHSVISVGSSNRGYMHRVLPAFCASPPAVLRPLARKALKVLDEERFFCANGEVLRG